MMATETFIVSTSEKDWFFTAIYLGERLESADA